MAEKNKQIKYHYAKHWYKEESTFMFKREKPILSITDLRSAQAVSSLVGVSQSSRNTVIRGNVSRIIDSIVFRSDRSTHNKLADIWCRLGAERFMGSSGELQELVVVEGSKMLMDGSLDVRKHAKHLWGELGQHSRTEGLLKHHLSGSHLREVAGIVEGLRWDVSRLKWVQSQMELDSDKMELW